MAVDTYIFKAQQIPEGSLTIIVTTSNGTGLTHSYPNDKYFSSTIEIKEETDGQGGKLKSFSAGFSIDDDKDLLFTNIIFNQLLVSGGFVNIKVKIDSTIRFYGSIISDTIQSETYFATDDSLGGKRVSINFRCRWILDVLKEINGDSLYEYLIADPSRYEKLQYSIDYGNISGIVTTYAKFSTYKKIIQSMLEMLNTTYSVNVSLDYGINDFVFFSQDNSEIKYIGFDENIYPDRCESRISDGSMFGNNPIGIIIQTGTIAFSGAVDSPIPSPLFNIADNNYIGNAYDIFIGIIKSFPVYPACIYDDGGTCDLIVKFQTRSGGDSTIISDIISDNDDYYSKSSSDKISVNSRRSGNSFERVNNVYGSSSYNEETLFDFGNDNDFPGGSESNTLQSSMVLATYNGKKTLQLVRYCGVGGNLIFNGNFSSSLVGLIGWSYAGSHFTRDGTLLAIKTDRASRTTEILSQTLNSPIEDNLLLSCDVRTTSFSTNLYLVLKMFSNGIEVSTKTVSIGIVVVGGWQKFSLYYNGKEKIDKIQFIVSTGLLADLNDSVTMADIWIDNIVLYRSRIGCPELLGRMVQDYFNNNNSLTKTLIVDGIKRLNIADYTDQFDGKKYYINKLNYKLSDNETEIETINYPY